MFSINSGPYQRTKQNFAKFVVSSGQSIDFKVKAVNSAGNVSQPEFIQIPGPDVGESVCLFYLLKMLGCNCTRVNMW